MKKALSLCLAVILAVSVCGLASFAARNGDMDADNRITASDARSILRAAVGLDTLTEEKKQSADLDMDGKITAADARIALRLSVGLDLASENMFANEYEVLLGGVYAASFVVTEEGYSQKMTMSFTPSTSYISMYIDNAGELMEGLTGEMTISLLFNSDGKTYLMDHEMKCYGEFPFEEMGMDPDELTGDFFTDAFGFLRPLSEATNVGTEKYDGISCKVYTFKASGGSYKAYLNGKKLVAITELDNAGKLLVSYRFSSVSLAVPSETCSLPASYAEADAIELLLLMMIRASSVPV